MAHTPGFLKIVDDAKTRIREMTVDAVRRSKEGGEAFYLVDVREDSEWNAAHAAGQGPGAARECWPNERADRNRWS
jgi:rhodanese-related sulfurtransferase